MLPVLPVLPVLLSAGQGLLTVDVLVVPQGDVFRGRQDEHLTARQPHTQ
jgi:hypothetical protein